MKKLTSIILSVAMVLTLLGAFALNSYAEEDLTITMSINNPIMTVNGTSQEIDPGEGTMPVIRNDRTLVPIRAIIEAMGGTVEWEAQSRTAILNYGEDEIRLVIDSTTAYLNNEANTLDSAPVIINDRTMLPIRFIAESFNFEVDWIQETQTVTIKKSSSLPKETVVSEQEPKANESDAIVVYFSRAGEQFDVGVVDKGNTAVVADMIIDATGADKFEILPKNDTYPTTYDALTEVAKEEQDNKARPEIASEIESFDKYDTVFLGYPIWWGDMPMIVYTFLESYNFDGKTVIPFCTHAGSGLSGTVSDIKNALSKADVKEGLAIEGTTAQNDKDSVKTSVEKWVDELGYTKSNTANAEANVGTNEFDLEKAAVILNNGVEMPIFGIGTFALSEEEAENSVYHALLDGYRLIDTANGYNNEEAVAKGIKRAMNDGDIKREDIFLTAKLWPTNYSMEGIDATLERLGVEYVDLMLLHQPFGDYVEGWKAMEQALAEGKVKAIGLSNFEQPALWDEILEAGTINPAVLQVETHPYYQQTAMMKYLDRFGTVIEAWYPLGGRGNTQVLFDDPTIVEIAKAHNKSSAQVILRWHLQAGHIAIPGSSNPDHIQENIEIFDFELSDEEMAKMTALDKSERFFNMPNSITPDEMEEYIMNAAAEIIGN